MSARAIIISVVVVVAVFSALFILNKHSLSPQACTLEAKLCPDGSTVGRTGPNCAFADCPTTETSSTTTPKQKTTNDRGYLIGHVILSPTCPVERMPPDPACAPKPYPALIDISGAHNFFIELHADMAGVFRTPLPIGTYLVITHQTTLYPRCESKTVTIIVGATTTADISCDTGIR